MSTRDKWIFGIAIVIAVGVANHGYGSKPVDAAPQRVSFELPANIHTMTCAGLNQTFEGTAQRLSDYVDGIYRGSWDAKAAQERLANGSVDDEGRAVLLALNKEMADRC